MLQKTCPPNETPPFLTTRKQNGKKWWSMLRLAQHHMSKKLKDCVWPSAKSQPIFFKGSIEHAMLALSLRTCPFQSCRESTTRSINNTMHGTPSDIDEGRDHTLTHILVVHSALLQRSGASQPAAAARARSTLIDGKMPGTEAARHMCKMPGTKAKAAKHVSLMPSHHSASMAAASSGDWAASEVTGSR